MLILWFFLYGSFFLPGSSLQNDDAEDESPETKIERVDPMVRLGDPINRTCTATGVPPPKITWSKDFASWPLPRTAMQADGVFHIPNARLSDEGTYFCTAANIHGKMIAETRVLIDLEDKKMSPHYYKQPLRVRINELKKLTPNEGDQISFQCEVRTKIEMRPQLTWTRLGNMEMPTDSVQDNYGLLTILNTSSKDAGVYRCTGTLNKTGEMAHDIGIVEIGPASLQPFVVAIKEPISKSVTENDTIEIFCEAVSGGTKPFKLIWTREDNAPLDDHISVKDGELFIFGGVKEQHAGTYICTGTILDTQTTSSDKIQLKVVPKNEWMLPWIEISPPELLVKAGDPINMTCRVPALRMRYPYKTQWRRDGNQQGTLPETAQVNYGNLYIPHARATDAGSYSCQISSKVGTSFQSVSVYIQSENKPPKVQVVPASKILKPGQNFAFKCNILEGYPTTQLSWIRDDKATLDDNIRTIKNGLQISDARVDNGGTYTCIGRNRFEEHRDTAELTVREDDLDIQVVKGVQNGTVTVPYFGTIRLDCLADAGPGRPKATVQWSYIEDPRPDNMSAPFTPVHIDRQYLRHYFPTNFNNGVYTCRGTSGNFSKQVSINVKVQPRKEKRVAPASI